MQEHFILTQNSMIQPITSNSKRTSIDTSKLLADDYLLISSNITLTSYKIQRQQIHLPLVSYTPITMGINVKNPETIVPTSASSTTLLKTKDLTLALLFTNVLDFLKDPLLSMT
jgi:hypothetical protein